MTPTQLDVRSREVESIDFGYQAPQTSLDGNPPRRVGKPFILRDEEPLIVLFAEAAGGVMRHVIDLYRGLRARQWRVRMIISPLRIEPRYNEELSDLDSRDITYVPLRREPHPSDLIGFSQVRQAIHQARGSVILHAHSTKAGMIGSRLHSRVRASIFTPHAFRSRDPTLSTPVRTMLQLVERNFSGGYDRVIAVAPAEMEYARNIIRLKERSLRCIPNGLDMDLIHHDGTMERRRRINGSLCLGFVGRFVHQKNPLLFIQVLAEVVARGANAHAIIVGDGPLEGEMRAAAERCGVASRIKWRTDSDASSSLHEMDIMVHTSFYEACPYSLIEACGALLPIVATSNDGSKAILYPHMSLNISSAADARELASIVMAIATDDLLRMRQMRILADIAREHSVKNMVIRTELEYQSLMQ
jgi:glycosyltransferase involved in cell wall biosynthesis